MWNDIDVNHILKYEYNFERNKNYFIYEAVLQAGYKPRDRRNAETNAATWITTARVRGLYSVNKVQCRTQCQMQRRNVICRTSIIRP